MPFERNGKHYTLIDTTGLRRRGKVFEADREVLGDQDLRAVEQANDGGSCA